MGTHQRGGGLITRDDEDGAPDGRQVLTSRRDHLEEIDEIPEGEWVAVTAHRVGDELVDFDGVATEPVGRCSRRFEGFVVVTQHVSYRLVAQAGVGNSL